MVPEPILARWNDWRSRPVVLTVAEAAELLRLDARTITDMLHRGDLAGNIAARGLKRGAVRVTSESVLDWLGGKRGVLPTRRKS